MKIGVVGNGFVGHAMTLLRPAIDVRVWDVDPEKREPRDLDFDDFVRESALLFVAVPTPMRKDGSCKTDIVESVVRDIKGSDPDARIIIRSTIPPGTSDSLDVSFMPEFLTEKNWESDFKNCKHWVIGTIDDSVATCVGAMLAEAYADGLITNKEVKSTQPCVAELVKYVKNCFLATKVSFFNELYDLCTELCISYDELRELSCEDDRIGFGHTQVPGHDGLRGFGGTCFPKDMSALLYFMESQGLESFLVRAALNRNNELDRPDKDWSNDVGRAVE